MQTTKRQEKVKYGLNCDEEDKEGLWVFTLMRLVAWSVTQRVDKMDCSNGVVLSGVGMTMNNGALIGRCLFTCAE